MTKQILKPSIKLAIKHDPELAAKLAKANTVVPRTIERWLREDDDTLTTATNLKIIREYVGIAESEVLTQDKEMEPAQN